MNNIQKAINIYELLRKHKYRITTEDGTIIELLFSGKRFHHLLGLQHLDDLPHIANPRMKMSRFYSEIKNGKPSETEIKKSVKYDTISERVENFDQLLPLMSPGEKRIIVKFDASKVDTVIEATFFVYKRDGFFSDATYFTLFIGQDTKTGEYYPATYIVEHSNKYIKDQDIQFCTIDIL